MGHQIIRQPDGRYAIFSSVVDSWIVYDATRQDVIDYYVELAVKDARRDVERTLDCVDDNPRKAYYQFTMTFEEANARSVAYGGEDLSGKAAPRESAGTPLQPARLSADLIMSDGRTVHVPDVPVPKPASAGRIRVDIPYPDSAAPGFVASVAVVNADLGEVFRSSWPGAYAARGEVLTVTFGEESLDAEALAWVFGEQR